MTMGGIAQIMLCQIYTQCLVTVCFDMRSTAFLWCLICEELYHRKRRNVCCKMLYFSETERSFHNENSGHPILDGR